MKHEEKRSRKVSVAAKCIWNNSRLPHQFLIEIVPPCSHNQNVCFDPAPSCVAAFGDLVQLTIWFIVSVHFTLMGSNYSSFHRVVLFVLSHSAQFEPIFGSIRANISARFEPINRLAPTVIIRLISTDNTARFSTVPAPALHRTFHSNWFVYWITIVHQFPHLPETIPCVPFNARARLYFDCAKHPWSRS